MGIATLMNKTKSQRVIGIDASTQSLAFAIFENGSPIQCGEIFFQGATVFERLHDARNKVGGLVKSGVLKGDLIVIESAIMVRNVQTAIDLAYVYGSILSELSEETTNLKKVAPISWQTGIGNPNLKKHEKDKMMQEFPGKSKSWYQNKGRSIRKQRTLDIARKHFSIPNGSDNVGDAVGIALWATETLTRP